MWALGPEPMVSYVYHKRALERQGFSAQTFVREVYFITDAFDVRADLLLPGPLSALAKYYLFILVVSRYRCLYTSFKGGPLGVCALLWRIEPFLYRVGSEDRDSTLWLRCPGPDTVAQPSVQACGGSRLPGTAIHETLIASKVDLWTRQADHIVGGCEWVDYMYHWDTLMLNHFSIDTELWKPVPETGRQRPRDPIQRLVILHAPNHRALKGSAYFEQAVKELKDEGFEVELKVVEKVPNNEMRALMRSADVVADQLVIGWYAMFAMEAMALGKPVLCYLREDLKRFYIDAGLISRGEIPIVECSPTKVKEVIKGLVMDREALDEIGKRSRAFIEKHHSLESVGAIFSAINRSIGLKPAGQNPHR